MKKLLLLVLVVTTFFGVQAQNTKISAMPVSSSAGDSMYLPIIPFAGGSNFKILGKNVAISKIDSIWAAGNNLMYRRWGNTQTGPTINNYLQGLGILINSLTISSDTLTVAQWVRLYKVRDSLLSIIYTKAQSDANYFPITGGNLSSSSNGWIGFPLLSASPASAANKIIEFQDSSGGRSYRYANGYIRFFKPQTQTANRIVWLPDSTGTMALADYTVPITRTVNSKALSSNVILDLSSDFAATILPIANGGTGQSTANNALNALLPTQTSNSGKVLQTNGTTTSWQSVGVGSVTQVTTNNFSPLFTANFATNTTTPVLSFTASTVAAHTYYSNQTSGSAVPTFAVPKILTDFTSEGTATTVLHGSAASNFTFSAVALSTDATGTGLSAITDTSANKPITVDGSGNIKKSTFWYGAGAGGTTAYQQNGSTISTRGTANLKDGNNTAAVVTDNSGSSRADIVYNQKYDWTWNFLFKLNVGGVGGIFYQNADGGASSNYTPVTGGKPGGFTGFVGTGTTGRIAFGTADPALWFDSSNSITTRTRLENVRWDGANVNNAYQLEIGFINGYGSANTKATNGCYFLYSDTLNSGKWIIECATNGSYTTTNTATSIDNTVAHNYEVIYKKFTVDFQIDGVSIGTITSGNIPNGSSRTFGAGMNMFKQSGTSDNAFQCEGWKMSWHVE